MAMWGQKILPLGMMFFKKDGEGVKQKMIQGSISFVLRFLQCLVHFSKFTTLGMQPAATNGMTVVKMCQTALYEGLF